MVLFSVCAVRVIGESDMMQDFLAAGDMEDVSFFFFLLWSFSDKSKKSEEMLFCFFHCKLFSLRTLHNCSDFVSCVAYTS